jgi:hypothetical protein
VVRDLGVAARDILNRSFTREGARVALDRYVQFAGSAGWSIPHKVELYEAGGIAGDPTISDAERRAAFRTIHGNLASSWQVFRPVGASRCWSSDQIFDRLVASDSSLARAKGMRASDVPRGSRDLVGALERLRPLKPGNHYPTMAVSKFAHFANPRLVPIYDEAIVWKVAFAEYKPVFDAYCYSVALDPDAWGARFLECYVAWAGSCVKRDPALLPTFAAWMRETVGTLPARVDREIETYEAAAFEMIFIGAAYLAQDRRT